MDKYIKLIKKIHNDFDENMIDIPFSKIGIDSLGLIELRVVFEKEIKFEFSDDQWSKFSTIIQIINFCNKNRENVLSKINKTISPSINKDIDINMSQMNNKALSENWLFKTLGDMHWELLFNSLETKSSLLSDSNKNRLYATFIKIYMKLTPLNSFKENQRLKIKGKLSRYGKSTYLSKFNCEAEENIVNAKLLTTFSKRKGKDNLELVKSTPDKNVDHIIEDELIKKDMDSHRAMKKEALINPKFEYEYKINPFYEINGVGLLYFASYPIISDYCESLFFNDMANIKQWESQYFTCERDMIYYSNCNIDDKIIYNLNSYKFIKNKVEISSSLYRKKDNKLMAKLFTVKKSNL